MNPTRRAILKWSGIALASSPVVGILTLSISGPGLLEQQRAAARREGIPLTPEDLRPNPPIPDAQNAGPLLKELTRRYGAIPEPEKRAYDKLYEAFSKSPDDPTARAALQKSLVQYADLMQLVERASALPHCDMAYDWNLGPNLLFPEFAVLRHFARMLSTRAWLATDASSAWRDIACVAKLGNLISETPCLIAALVGVAIHAIADRAYVATLKRFGPSVQAHETLFAFGPPPSPEHYFGGEVVMNTITMKLIRREGLQIINDVGSDAESLDVNWKPDKLLTPLAAPFWERQMIMLWRQAFPQIREAQRTGRYAELGRWFDVTLKQVEQDKMNLPQNLMVAVLFPVLSQATNKTHLQTATLRHLRETALALLEAKAKTGTFPTSPSLPSDPFSPTGQPLRYRKDGDGCVLYSIGQDHTDDGGVEKRTSSSEKLDLVVRL